MVFETEIPTMENKKANIYLTKEGEVYTDIFGVRLKFSVNEKNARQLMRDIIKNCRGYEKKEIVKG